MPTQDDFDGVGYFKGSGVKIGVSHTKFSPEDKEFWTPERKKVDLQFLLVGLAAFALFAYYGKK
jgi:hypothetical protein